MFHLFHPILQNLCLGFSESKRMLKFKEFQNEGRSKSKMCLVPCYNKNPYWTDSLTTRSRTVGLHKVTARKTLMLHMLSFALLVGSL